MAKHKIIHISDICVVVAVLMVYGCASAKKENSFDWAGINYSKIACGGLNEAECKKENKEAVMDSGGKR